MNNCRFLGNQMSAHELNANAGSWSFQENLSYAIFIDIHKKSMTSKKKMREMQFYDKLSAFVKTRTSSQCRSHHQKLFNKFKTISNIREIFKSKLGITTYKNKYTQGIQKMEAIEKTFLEKPQEHRPEEDPVEPLQIQMTENIPAAETCSHFFPFGNLMFNFGMSPISMLGGVGWMPMSGGIGPMSGGYFHYE